MSLSSDLQNLFSDCEERAVVSVKKKVVKRTALSSRYTAAYNRSLIVNPGRADLTASEFFEFSMLHRRLRVDGFISDFSSMSLSSMRTAAISMELAAASKCSF